ncbi:MAG: hypothetical protein IJQ81_01435, partial [Oscillibacter sp.]|nr:hypothetical protein [Oscillibacter sp.]
AETGNLSNSPGSLDLQSFRGCFSMKMEKIPQFPSVSINCQFEAMFTKNQSRGLYNALNRLAGD